MIQVTFYPGVNKRDLEDGAIVHVSFQRVKAALEKLVNCADNEAVVGVTITDTGIKCKIETLKTDAQLKTDKVRQTFKEISQK